MKRRSGWCPNSTTPEAPRSKTALWTPVHWASLFRAKRGEKSDAEGYAEPHLWTGIGRARSGCGAALVGSPEQITEKLRRYHQNGHPRLYPLGLSEFGRVPCAFGELVLPKLETLSLPRELGRIPSEVPLTPLGAAPRR